MLWLTEQEYQDLIHFTCMTRYKVIIDIDESRFIKIWWLTAITSFSNYLSIVVKFQHFYCKYEKKSFPYWLPNSSTFPLKFFQTNKKQNKNFQSGAAKNVTNNALFLHTKLFHKAQQKSTRNSVNKMNMKDQYRSTGYIHSYNKMEMMLMMMAAVWKKILRHR